MTQVNTVPNGHYVQANGLDMYYEQYGAGEPLILLHGGMGIGRNFQHLIPDFSSQFRIITPDLRGYGQTDNPSAEISYRLMADDVAALTSALHLNQPSICGWSDGGQIALELGMRYPDLVKCMVVGAAWYQFSQTYQSLLRAMGFESSTIVDIEKIKKSMPQLVDLWRSWHSRIHGPDHWETLAAQISNMWWTRLNYPVDDFQKIKIPTLILVGDRDQMVPVEEAVEMYRHIEGAELAVIHNSDHSLPRTRADMFSAIVLDFLLRHKD